MTAPSNNQFRIAGALGIEPNPSTQDQEVLTQGLGFPLRPISGVPQTDSPDVEDVVAQGYPMQWMGAWNEGKYYPAGAYVTDGSFAAVANKVTLEKPAPIPDPADPATYGITDWIVDTGLPPVTQSNTSVVVSGQNYVFNQSGWIKELRIWVTELTAATSYRIVIVNNSDPINPVTAVIDDPLLTENNWRIVALLNEIVRAGDSYFISIDALNSGADTNISGGWAYQGPTQSGPPVFQNWTIDNQRTTFRIDKTDLDAVDRGTELESVIPETTIAIVQTNDVGKTMNLRVTAVVDGGTFMNYTVVLTGETGGGPDPFAICTLDIDVPIALPTEYAEQTLQFSSLPSWATSVHGSLSFDGVDQGVPVTNGYGVDILFEPAEVSPDWDIVSFDG